MNKYCSKHFIFKYQILWSFYMYMGGYLNFLNFFIKCLSTPNKFPKCLWLQKGIKENIKGPICDWKRICQGPFCKLIFFFL